jgi:regulator of sigma E protease
MLAFLANVVLETVLPFLLLITVIVTIHELGHFLVARAFGVAVDRFSVGFGRTIFAIKDRWGVEWRVAWLPLGGYVKFSGDENVASVPDQDDLADLKTSIALREGVGAERRYFHFKPLWQRALVVFAGPAANFVLSIALFALLYGTMGDEVASLQIHSISANSAAAAAGVLPGDVVVEIGGQKIERHDDLVAFTQDRPGVRTVIEVRRAGALVDLPITIGAVTQPSPAGGTVTVGQLGIESLVTRVQYNPIQAIGRGADKTWSIVAQTGHYVARMVQGKADWPFSGFLGTAHVTGAVTKEAVDISNTEHLNLWLTLAIEYTYVAAVLSTSIGLVNLLPIPVLDGGHLAFYAFEAVARRPVPAVAQAAGYRVGLALLVGLMLFTTWHDLQRMQVFHFLGALFS